MNPLVEHVSGTASIHAVGLSDEVGIVYGKLVGQQLEQVTRTVTACLLFSRTVGAFNGLAEECHLAVHVVLKAPADKILNLTTPFVVVADIEHTSLQIGNDIGTERQVLIHPRL